MKKWYFAAELRATGYIMHVTVEAETKEEAVVKANEHFLKTAGPVRILYCHDL